MAFIGIVFVTAVYVTSIVILTNKNLKKYNK